MNALVEFDEKEFWIQLFSIVARREEKTENEDVTRHSAPEAKESPGASLYPGEGVFH
jgi:hypothetical protein